MSNNDMALSPGDEFFGHQVALPIQSVASSDPGWRERYWISVHDVVNQDFVLSTGYGKYPNRDTIDGFCVAAHQHEQHNLRVSRTLAPRYTDIAVGPMSVEIIDPLKTFRFRLDDNPSGTSYDLTWHASVPPALEGRHFEVNRGRISHDLVRYVQTGRLSGEIIFNGERHEVTPDRWWGVRDHSWGMRPMTGVPGDPPVASVKWNLLVFMPIQFPSFSVHVYLFESQPGRPTHLSAAIMRPAGSGEHDDEVRSVSHDFNWVKDAPIQTLIDGRFRIELFSGQVIDIEMRACPGRVFLKGGGYGSAHGKWQGDDFSEHETWDLTDEQALRGYNHHSSDHLIEARCDGETGYGIIEYLIRRGYGKYADAHRPREKRIA